LKHFKLKYHLLSSAFLMAKKQYRYWWDSRRAIYHKQWLPRAPRAMNVLSTLRRRRHRS